MKKIMLLGCILCLLSCQNKNSMDVTIAVADSMMEANSDYAPNVLHKLDSMKINLESASAEQQMRYQLIYAKAMNKANVPFTSDEIMVKVKTYYDRKGTLYDRIQACYLLGCVYRDLGDGPKALQCYNEAISNVGSTNKDYLLMSIILNQKAEVLDAQGLLRSGIVERGKASKYAYMAGDTLDAILYGDQTASEYAMLGHYDSAAMVSNRACRILKKMGYYHDADQVEGSTFTYYVRMGDFATAKEKMQIYENKSGFFHHGAIEPGREIYYYFKGLYYLGIHQPDSADFLFRKCLTYDNKNMQLAGSRGLSLLYNQLNISDSTAKYALISYAENDSAYIESNAATMLQIQALYKYNQYQEIANKKSLEAKTLQIWLLIAILLFTFIFGTVYVLYRKRLLRKEQELNRIRILYETDMERLLHEKNELEDLRKHDAESNSTTIMEKVNRIKILEQRIDVYKNQLNAKKDVLVEERIQNSDVALKFKSASANPVKYTISEKDWEDLETLIGQEVPYLYMILQKNNVSEKEKKICYLLRLNYKPLDIAVVLGLNPSTVSMARSRLLKRLFDVEGKAEEFDKKIRKIQ